MDEIESNGEWKGYIRAVMGVLALSSIGILASHVIAPGKIDIEHSLVSIPSLIVSLLFSVAICSFGISIIAGWLGALAGEINREWGNTRIGIALEYWPMLVAGVLIVPASILTVIAAIWHILTKLAAL